MLALIAVAGLIGFGAGHYTNRTKTVGTVAAGAAGSTTADPTVAAGAHVFVQFACAQCHGLNGEGGVSPDVPQLKSVGKTLTVAQLAHIINHGLGESANPTQAVHAGLGCGDLEASGRRAR